MSRWLPDSPNRLRDAAIELYAERGYAATTVAAVADRAGVTERTFYRHFADKREVLFGNEDALRDQLVAAVAAAPDGASTREVIAAGLAAVAATLQPMHAELRRREPVIAAHPELRERELSKLQAWTAALEGGLIERGVDRPVAILAAGPSIAVFNVAAQRWLAVGRSGSLAELAAAAAAEFRALA